MPAKTPIALVLLNLAVFAAATAAVPLAFSRYIPHFSVYEDTTLVDTRMGIEFSPSLCQLTFLHQRTLETTKTEGHIWQRLPTTWQGHSRIGGHGDEVKFESGDGKAMRFVSQIQFATRRPVNEVYVSNRMSAQLPEEACRSFGSLPTTAK